MDIEDFTNEELREQYLIVVRELENRKIDEDKILKAMKKINKREKTKETDCNHNVGVKPTTINEG